MGLIIQNKANAYDDFPYYQYLNTGNKAQIIFKDDIQDFADKMFDVPGEIQAPILLRNKKRDSKFQMLGLSTGTSKGKYKKGFKIRGLSFYYMPNSNTRWKLKIRKNKIQIKFNYKFN